MPTRRFEGPDLETTIARARTELGTRIRVVSAERVRGGGLGGFVAREKVEVEVEFGDDSRVAPREAPRGAPHDGPADLLEIADVVSKAEQAVATAERVRGPVVGVSRPMPGVSGPMPAMVSTERPSFGAVFDRFMSLADNCREEEIDLPSLESHAVEAPPVESHNVVQPAPIDDERCRPATFPVLAANGPHPRAEARSAMQPRAQLPAATPRPAPAQAPQAEPVRPASREVESDAAPAPTTVWVTAPPQSPPVAPPVTPPAPKQVREPAPAPPASTNPSLHQLKQLGLPVSFLPASEGSLRGALIERLRSLPTAPPPPSTKGTVMVVAGPVPAATAAARTIAPTLGVDPDSIVVITPNRQGAGGGATLELTTPSEIDDHRRSWRWRAHPTLVALDAPMGPGGQAWAAEMLASLEPTAAWGVADAWRKPEDIAAWSDSLGGLDALTLAETGSTSSPATVLQLGLPVALLDGEAATPERWADLLLDRLTP